MLPVWQRLGFNIIPNHFYEPIPDLRSLPNRLWETESALVGLSMNEEFQLDLLNDFSKTYKSEYETFPLERTGAEIKFYLKNGRFQAVDAEILYCMIRRYKPKRIFEIGSGYSTLLSAQAVEFNREKEGHACELIAYEPYPAEWLKRGFPGLSGLVEKRVEDVPVEEFEKLEDHDILFIDSSHALRIGGDVQYEILEILPRLAPGVAVHFHDIFLPQEYPKDWILKEHSFWTEQYVLHAFMAFNSCFEVVWGSNFLRVNHSALLIAAFPSLVKSPSRPASFWIRRFY
jgi:predicted O-methyltransferase YrrM